MLLEPEAAEEKMMISSLATLTRGLCIRAELKSTLSDGSLCNL